MRRDFYEPLSPDNMQISYWGKEENTASLKKSLSYSPIRLPNKHLMQATLIIILVPRSIFKAMQKKKFQGVKPCHKNPWDQFSSHITWYCMISLRK